MQNHKTHYTKTIPALLIALGLGLLSSSAVRAQDNNRSIVGLWDAHFYSGGAELFETHVQWHSDGLEFEVNSIYPGAVCQGVFKTENGVVKLHHVVFTYDANGVFNGRLDETQINTVGREGNRYQGKFDIKAYDLNGNFLGETTGIIRATRISVD
ncbi:MAG: hypothetical protein H0X34_03600 [Chthoniobacterales bacterium]|nr:hypothetical protein [Chthoniobacterales bacterium]